MEAGASPDIGALLAHRSFVLALARSLCRDAADAEDVAQETWRSVAARGGARAGDSRSWLARITRNHAFNLVRSRLRRARREADVDATRASELDPASVAERVELTERVVRAVMALEEPLRATILLHYYEDRSTRAIAQAHGVSIDTVRWRIERGLERLRRGLDAHHAPGSKSWRKELAILIGASSAAATATAGSSVLAPLVLAGIVVGGFAILTQVAREEDPPRQPTAGFVPTRTVPDEEDPSAAIATIQPEEPTRVEQSQAPSFDVRAGEFVLHIGDGARFAESTTLPGVRDRVDLYCLDLRDSWLSLHVPYGAALAKRPSNAVGVPSSPAEAARFVDAAPEELPEHEISVRLVSSGRDLAIFFVRDRNGATYRVHVAEFVDDADALLRSVRLGFDPVPTAVDGGVLRLPVADGHPSPLIREAISRAVALGSALPEDSYADQLRRDFVTSSQLDRATALRVDVPTVVGVPLDAELLVDGHSALFAAAGVGPDGAVKLGSFGAVGVLGATYGSIDVKSHGFVYLSGPLYGSLALAAHATVVLESDLVGTLCPGSDLRLLLRGRVPGTIRAGEGSGDFWFDGYWTRAELERLGTDAHRITLHVRESDLPKGEHEGFGGWRKVIVGEQQFERFPR